MCSRLTLGDSSLIMWHGATCNVKKKDIMKVSRKIILTVSLALAVVFGLTTGVSIASKGKNKKFMERAEVCKSDVEKFCADKKGEKGAISACLEEHKDELTSECQTFHEKRQQHRELVDACESDLKKFCPRGKHKGDGKSPRACLLEHKEELSSTCQDKLKSFKENRL